MKKVHIVIAFVLCITLLQYVYGLQITEIMFNPEGADTGREWIEIKLNNSDGCINFTEYKLFEENTNHNIYGYAYDAVNHDTTCKYAIISNDISKFLQDYPYLNSTLNSTDLISNVTIYKSSFSLSNDGEYIAVKKEGNIIDEINYTLLIENIDVTEGHSLEYHSYANFWRNSMLLKGNPGDALSDDMENSNTTNTNATVNESEINITTNLTATNFTEDNSSEQSNQSDPDQSNYSEDDRCNISISVLIKNTSTVYENNIPIKFQNRIETNNSTIEASYTIEYWIEDLFGNILKNKVSTNNQDEKSFTPKIEESDKILVIKDILKDYSINNHSCSLSNNTDEKIFLVKNSLYSPAKPTPSTTCPSCSSKASTCGYDKCSDICSNNIQNNSQNNNSQNALIKIINVCNESKTEQPNNDIVMQDSLIQRNYGLNQIQTLSISPNNISNTSKTNNTQNAGKTTGMIIYESPNVKNRVYALIGLILVGTTCIFFVVHKIMMHYSDESAKYDAESAKDSKR